MTVRDRSKVKMPACPQCAAPAATDWIDISTVVDKRAEYIPGKVWCTANQDHDVRALYGMGWAVEVTPTLHIDGGEGVEVFTLDIKQDVIRDVTMHPKPDPKWEFTDGNGHYHAYSDDKDDHYPTLESTLEHVECDGACGESDECEGYDVRRYRCRACGEEIQPSTIPGPHTEMIPGLKSWTATVTGRVRHLTLGQKVTLELRDGDQVTFGAAAVTDLQVGPYESKATFVGIGPLGHRRRPQKAEQAA